MGQQQLLLLVLSVIVVGLAVLGGIYAFESKSKQFAVDILVSRNLEVANAAVMWKTKKDPFDGGTAEYTGLATDGLEKLRITGTTETGTVAITSATATSLVITSVSSQYPDIGARTYVNRYSIDSTAVSYDGDITIE